MTEGVKLDWSVSRIIEATGGRLVRGEMGASVREISTDSRRIGPGDAFVALVGENHDAHCFLAQAVDRGAAVLVVSRKEAVSTVRGDVPIVLVEDTLRALGDLGRYRRDRAAIPVVGITGSNGKTSTKEMVAAVLSTRWKVLKNAGNLNNLIGVPLTLLSLDPSHEAAVIEMGINVPGEMDRLVAVAGPTVGLITNIHPAHLEGLQSEDAILLEKAALWRALGRDGLAVVNRDDERLDRLASSISARKVTFSSKSREAHVMASGRPDFSGGRTRFAVDFEGKVLPVTLAVIGEHQTHNAVAAAAVGYGLGLSPEAVVEGLNGHRPVPQRMETLSLPDGTVIINDTYNANPVSVIAAVRTAVQVAGKRPVVVVLGEMRELGPQSPHYHRMVGRRIGGLGLSRLITQGPLAQEISRGAREAGFPAHGCCHVENHEEAVAELLHHWHPGAWILLKGSRGMRMERVLEAILQRMGPPARPAGQEESA